MKIWNAPVMQELDVKLTAKMPSTVEQDITFSQECGWLAATYNTSTGESVIDCPDDCPGGVDCKCGTAS